MLTSLLITILWVAIYAVITYLIILLATWLLGLAGVVVPAIVLKIIWILFALCMLLWLVQGGFPTPGYHHRQWS